MKHGYTTVLKLIVIIIGTLLSKAGPRFQKLGHLNRNTWKEKKNREKTHYLKLENMS